MEDRPILDTNDGTENVWNFDYESPANNKNVQTSEDEVTATTRDLENVNFNEPRKYKNRRIPIDVPLLQFISKPKPANFRECGVIVPQQSDVLTATCENSLDKKVLDLLKHLKTKQDEQWKKNENKTRAHRRLVCGFHESHKHSVAGNVRCIFISKNVDPELIYGNAASLYHKLRTECMDKQIPLIFASTKKALSKAVSKHPYTNCVALLRFPGYEDEFSQIVNTWKEDDQYIQYHIDQRSLIP